MNRLPLLLLMPCVIAACHTQAPPVEPVVSVIAQWSGDQGGGEPGLRVLRTTNEWNAFWKRVERDPPRTLDTAREMALAVSLGTKRSGGFGAEISAARVEDNTLIVEYTTTAPPPGAMVTQALTSPWAIAIVPRSDLSVAWRNLAQRRSSQD